MPPVRSGRACDSPLKHIMSENTPTKQMAQLMSTAPVLAPPATMSPASAKMPPQMLAVITIMVRRNRSRPFGSMI